MDYTTVGVNLKTSATPGAVEWTAMYSNGTGEHRYHGVSASKRDAVSDAYAVIAGLAPGRRGPGGGGGVVTNTYLVLVDNDPWHLGHHSYVVQSTGDHGYADPIRIGTGQVPSVSAGLAVGFNIIDAAL